MYDRVSLNEKLVKMICKIGQCSYEIYFIQIAVFVLFPIGLFTFIKKINVRLLLWILFTFIVSIVGGLIFNITYSAVLNRIKVLH